MPKHKPASGHACRPGSHRSAARKRAEAVLPGVALILAACAFPAAARGVSPYLPLQESPEIERMIERVLILADQPVLARPIAAATVLDALPKACERDAALCERVRHYLAGFQKNYGVGYMSLSAGAAASDETGAPETSEGAVPLPNRHGMGADSGYEVAGRVFWQPSDHVLLNAGVVAYKGDATPTGTLVSFGVEKAQVDIGWRDHWLSPMSDSAMLIGTQARTMPGVTLSNYKPLTRLGLRYELFISEMSESSNILFQGALTTGNPRLAGLHLSIEPFPGWSIAVNRILQYGGGERPDGFSDLFDAFFNPSGYDNANPGETEFGNQAASVTSTFLVPARVPFAVYFEYAGEDTSRGTNYRLGNSALSAGIRFPSLANRFDLTVELSDWQNGWYVHHIYLDGLVNEGNVIGHWGADWRVRGDGVGASSAMARVGWQLKGGAFVEATYRTLHNAAYTAPDYERAHSLDLLYSRSWKRDFHVGGELEAGRDPLDRSYSRLSLFLRF
ncbi:MAG TPA: capsule assembly Wzi family protein [Gammaproteobacteria bacterium]|nr:capsule assembly Wzi family protein [Gammaproteobacteria bacterium]